MSDSIIEDGINRYFSQAFSKEDCIAAEANGCLLAQWKQSVDNGYANLLSSEEMGGAGIPWEDAFPLFWGLGFYRVPLPLAETVVANFILSKAGHMSDSTLPIALADEISTSELRISEDGGGLVITGSVPRVQWARACEEILLSLPDGKMGLWKLKQPSISITEHTDITKLPCDTVVFEGVRAELVFQNPFEYLDMPVRHFGAVAHAAMIVGATEFALQESVQYAQDRVQFGRPIGKNQALQQQLAQMAGQIAVARHAAILAFEQIPSWWASESRGDAVSAGCAKLLAGESADIATTVAHQVHGAIGFTYEHALNFATRRLWAWRENHGTASWWAKRIGAQVVAEGEAAFWPAMTHPNLYRGLQGSGT